MLKANGHTVGFLGDGINDAPALREADVGISVDTAVDIAKESADIIMLEKSLMFLKRWGYRRTPDIRKYHQIYQNGRELKFWQCLQRVGSKRIIAIFAHDASSIACSKPSLRYFTNHHSF